MHTVTMNGKKIKKKTLNIATHGKMRNNENIKSNNHLNLNNNRQSKICVHALIHLLINSSNYQVS